MKTIYVVYYDWAFNDGNAEGYLGIYENKEDAIRRMEEYWEEEKALDYFEKFDNETETEHTREAWEDGYYASSHSCVKVYEEQLYSHEDVINGLDN